MPGPHRGIAPNLGAVVSSQTPAGWYPPDPTRPGELRYWDGTQWTEQAAVQGSPHGNGVPWVVSWPAIVIGFFLCLVPGLVLLWVRPGTSTRVKGTLSAAAVGAAMLLVALTPPTEPAADLTAAAGPVTAQSTSAAPAPAATPASPTPAPAATTSTPRATPSSKASTTPTPPADRATTEPTVGAAILAVEALKVKGRAPRTGYDRAQFGSGWVDVDRNGCDSRNDQLKSTLSDRDMSGACKVLAGTLADPYTDTTIRFEYGGASEVDLDHLVALSDAWQKGAAAWPFAKRVAFANDPLNLQPTSARANRQKGDGDAATWLPSNKSYRCTYVARQAAVKTKYKVSVTAAERDAMLRVLAGCPEQALPVPGPQPTIASNTGGKAPASTPKPAKKPAPKPSKSSTSPPTATLDPQFRTCGEANDAGYGPYSQGSDPECDWYQDRDHDGLVCER